MQREQRVTMEAEIEEMQLHAKGHQGTPRISGSHQKPEEGKGGFFLQVSKGA